MAAIAALGTATILLSGCSVQDVSSSMKSYFAREAQAQEETAEVSIENRMFSAQVHNAAGEPLTKQDGEALTVLAAYETAAGGEDRINERGVAETYPVGQVMTYKAGEAVLGDDGEPETYAGGETVTGVFGSTVKDDAGNPVTRSAGEIVTHGDSDVVYDAQGNKVLSTGEPLTYAYGEYMYNTDGEQVFSGVVFLQDEFGQPATQEDGTRRVSPIEIVTEANGDPVLETNGEVATRVLEPLLPQRTIDQPLEEGAYYIRSIASPYVYFSAPEVYAENVHVPDGAEPDTAPQAVVTEADGTVSGDSFAADSNADNEQNGEDSESGFQDGNNTAGNDSIDPGEDTYDNNDNQQSDAAGQEDAPTAGDIDSAEPADTGDGSDLAGEQGTDDHSEETSAEDALTPIRNIQLEVLGENLPYFELRFDAWGYGYFVAEGTEQVLGVDGSIRNGANILLQDMDKLPYPQYAYWDEPLYSLADDQKWIIRELEDGYYEICSAANPEYCLTVDDAGGIHFANIMLWKYEERDQQKFSIEADVPTIQNTLEEGSYFIGSGVSGWMMVSIGDYNYDDGRNIYLYHSDGLDGQVFTLTYDDYGLAVIKHSDSNKALSVENGDAINEQNVFQYEYDGGDWQKWILEPVAEDGSFILRSARNVSEVLNLMGGVANELRPIRMYWNDNTMSQRWYFETEAPEGPFTADAMARYAQRFTSNTGYLILVDTITNHVGIYTGWQYNWSTVYYWDCVTGKASTPTLKGTYTINGRLPSFNGDTDAPEEYTCYYATMFYPEYFFHSQVYYKDTEDLMDGTMGWNASHGCVRLYIDNAKWIYENIPDGTTVYSY